MSQFRKADSSVYTVFLDMIEKVFPELTGYSFGLLYREKIKKSKGGLILAEICQPTKLLSYFAKNDNGNPFDFLIIVDEMAWCCAKECDRIRLMRHELRHVNISDKGVARLIGHDYQDFYKEVDINVDDPTWCQKLVEVILAGYNQVKAGEKDPRNEPREGVKEMTRDPQRQTQLPVDSKNAGGTIAKAPEDDKGVTPELIAVELGSKKAKDVILESLDTGPSSKVDEFSKSKGLKGLSDSEVEREAAIDKSIKEGNVSMSAINSKARSEKMTRVSNFA